MSLINKIVEERREEITISIAIEVRIRGFFYQAKNGEFLLYKGDSRELMEKADKNRYDIC